MLYSKKYSGFTLVELSVVIVIIGLIVAGIVGGTNLIRSSKINTIISEVGATRVAYNSFYLNFDQLAGDFDKAYDYWGANCDAVASKCNGNGNKFISWNGAGDLGSTNTTDDNETFRAWQHLSLSGLIKQSFTGKSTLGDTHGATKEEMYFSSTQMGKYFIGNLKYLGGVFGKHASSTLLVFGGRKQGENIWTGTLTVADAFNIDKKMDDGIANSGKVLATSGLATTECSRNLLSPTGSDYNLTNLSSSSLYCVMVFAF